MASNSNRKRSAPSGAFVATALFLTCLWIAGGGSRADLAGQIVVRAASWIALAAFTFLTPPSDVWRGKAVLCLLLAAVALVLIQLIPLPPTVWSALPGRSVFVSADEIARQPTWRPIAIVPSAAINAAGALVVPLATYCLVIAAGRSTDNALVATVLALTIGTAFVGLVQLAGVSIADPFVNTGTEASGTFANRNHFALFLALGCLLAPVWAFRDRPRLSWRAFAAAAAIPLLLLTILASGSRAGIAVGAIALAGGIAMVWPILRAATRDRPRWVGPAMTGGFLLLVLMLGLFSYGEGRTASIHRAIMSSVGSDMRGRGFSTVLSMIWEYFPVGTGFGGFDPLFRLHEPTALLKPTYFNRAHNDFLEVVLDGGIAGAAVMACGIAWWLFKSVAAWRSTSADMLPKLGSLIILLIVVASAFDYPARTPMVMAVLIIAGIWLSTPPEAGGGLPLRVRRS